MTKQLLIQIKSGESTGWLVDDAAFRAKVQLVISMMVIEATRSTVPAVKVLPLCDADEVDLAISCYAP